MPLVEAEGVRADRILGLARGLDRADRATPVPGVGVGRGGTGGEAAHGHVQAAPLRLGVPAKSVCASE
jgi:hypothetical protein